MLRLSWCGHGIVRTFDRQLVLVAVVESEGEGDRVVEVFDRGVANADVVGYGEKAPEDAGAFQWMHEIIDYEPAGAFGRELLGRLASIGIELVS